MKNISNNSNFNPSEWSKTIIYKNIKLSPKEYIPLSNGNISYRCFFTKICKGLFHFTSESIKDYKLENIPLLNCFKTVRDHSEQCLNMNGRRSTLNNNISFSFANENNIIFQKSLELNSFTKTLDWHYNESQKLNMNLSKRQVKYRLDLVKNANYAEDKIYLENIFTYF